MADQNLVVIGAGPGGYSAAFHAADAGMTVTLVDADPHLGGVCLHRGCIPSKTLLHLARIIQEAKEAAKWGLDFGEPVIDLDKIRAWKNRVIGKMSAGLSMLSRQRKVRFIEGKATFKDSNTIAISGHEDIVFDHCVLATGSRPAIPEVFGGTGSRLMDSTTALELADIPERLLIVGGGYIGLEMGTVYSALGSRVTVVEMTDGLLPGVDRDLVRPLHSFLEKDFQNIYLNTRVVSLEDKENSLRVIMEKDSDKLEEIFDKILVSVGRKPNSEKLRLENTRVSVDEKGFVEVDSCFKTRDPAISAIGDVVGGPMLAHKATAEGRAVVEILKGNAEPSNVVIPAVIFTDPEIAWCGITESQARADKRDMEVSRFPWSASGRAQTLGRTEGVTKLIMDPATRKPVGAGITGVGAGELIGEMVLAIQAGIRIDQLAHSVHPHPTLSETLMEAAEACLGISPHIYKPIRK